MCLLHYTRSCLFRIGDLRPYVEADPDRLWEKRSTAGLSEKVKTAAEGNRKRAVDRTPQEKQAISELQADCVHAEFNAFHNAPFGDVVIFLLSVVVVIYDIALLILVTPPPPFLYFFLYVLPEWL